jgi:hypothetical protein
MAAGIAFRAITEDEPAASTDIARNSPSHHRTHRPVTAGKMPALQKTDLQRKAA